MRGGKAIAFIVPLDVRLPSTQVRAKCIADFIDRDLTVRFIQGKCPAVLNNRIGRRVFKFFFNIISVIKLKLVYKKIIVLIIKPNSILLVLFVRFFLGVKCIVDINDPIHLPEFVGKIRTLGILKLSNLIIFESPEYSSYWSNRGITRSVVIEDTPQFEFIYLDFLKREHTVVWVGSPSTSKVLLNYIPHLHLFSAHQYSIKLLGASDLVAEELKKAGLSVTTINQYDHTTLVNQLSNSQISFVPMPNEDLYTLRGNLKAKISMACGCLTIASRNKMHERLITDGKTGYLFDSINSLDYILAAINNRADKKNVSMTIAFEGNCYVASKFTRENHASEVCKAVSYFI